MATYWFRGAMKSTAAMVDQNYSFTGVRCRKEVPTTLSAERERNMTTICPPTDAFKRMTRTDHRDNTINIVRPSRVWKRNFANRVRTNDSGILYTYFENIHVSYPLFIALEVFYVRSVFINGIILQRDLFKVCVLLPNSIVVVVIVHSQRFRRKKKNMKKSLIMAMRVCVILVHVKCECSYCTTAAAQSYVYTKQRKTDRVHDEREREKKQHNEK